MTTPTKEMTPEELNKLQRFNNRSGLMNPEPWGLYVRYEEIALIAQARASLPNAAASLAVPDEQSSIAQHEAIEAAVDQHYPKQDTPHASVKDRIGAARLAFRKGYRAALAAKEPAPATQQPNELSRRLRARADALGRINENMLEALLNLAADEIDHLSAASVPAQQIGGSIDTPEFESLLYDWHRALPGADSAREAVALIAHIDAHVATKVQAVRDEASKKAARWEFMMRIADNEDGPEERAMEAAGHGGTFDSARPKSVQLEEMVDQAMAALRSPAATDAEGK